MTRDDVPQLPQRDSSGHKGTFGTVCIVGGCDHSGTTIFGAPLLAARGALRAGVGLCRIMVPGSLVPHALASLPSAMASGFSGVAPETIGECSAAVIGPGLAPAGRPDRPIFDLLKNIHVPAVIDADGLNALAAGVLASRRTPDLSSCVLTPHPGEYQRLADAFRLREDPIDPRARESATYELARRLGCVVVLKGARTVVSDGSSLWVCRRGHACMATGGTGDVLAGMLGGLLAQNEAAGWRMNAFDLSRIAVDAHAAAGQAWARHHGADAGMLAHELADLIPPSLWGLRVS